MSKALVDLLVQRPEAELREMRASVNAERKALREQDERLSFEEQLLVEALAKKQLAAAREPGANGAVASVKLRREQVRDMIAQLGDGWVWPAQVRDAFHAEGVPVNVEALRQAMKRLVKDNKLLNDPDKGYRLPPTNGSLLDPQGAHA